MSTKNIYLREWRKFRGLTQDALAEKAEYSKSFVSQLEREERGYTRDNLHRLAVALGTTPAALISIDPSDSGMVDTTALFGHSPEFPDRQRLEDCVFKVLRTLLGRDGPVMLNRSRMEDCIVMALRILPGVAPTGDRLRKAAGVAIEMYELGAPDEAA